jgi:hypothetical protein
VRYTGRARVRNKWWGYSLRDRCEGSPHEVSRLISHSTAETFRRNGGSSVIWRRAVCQTGNNVLEEHMFPSARWTTLRHNSDGISELKSTWNIWSVTSEDFTAVTMKTEINVRGGSAALTTRHPSLRKSWLYISPTSGGRSVGIVRLRTKGHGVCFFLLRRLSSSGIYAVWLLLRTDVL